MAIISGGDGGHVLVGTDTDDVIYGHSIADTLPDVGQIVATRVASGFSVPVFAGSAPGDASLLYVVEKDLGQILLLDPSTGNRSVFLAIPAEQLTTDGEQGLLSVAFHPDYAVNGRFFVNLVNAQGDVEVRSYTRSSGDPAVADPDGTTVITVPHPGDILHNGGTVAFGPDGYLYVSIGDGGGVGDPGENAQNIDSLLGKMLRLDVDGDAFPGDPTRKYAIPADNPFVGQPGADEIWAYGLRNPWRFSFDSASGDLYIGDVGQGLREEIDFQAAGTAGGLNFGWDTREGTLFFEGPDSPGFTSPIFEYDRTLGQCVIGGYVYHGPAPGMQGAYIFADLLSDRIWSLLVANGRTVDVIERTGQIVTGGAPLGFITSFGVDGSGALHAITLTGEIYRLAPSVAAGDGSDTIFGGSGNDRIAGGIGNDVIDGGTGNDTLIFGDAASDYTTVASGGTFVVFTNASGEHDRAVNIEHFQFADVTINASAVATFEAFDYLASYADLIAAFGPNAQGGFDHYVTHGFAEGRVQDGFDNFDYLASWGDLIAAFGADPQAAARHYVTFGFREGRALDTFGNFDYLASWDDLIAAFGPDAQAAARHYVASGFNEGRARDAFDNFEYLASWDDLIATYGPDAPAAAWHYVTFGFDEGRARDAFDNFQYLASWGDLIAAFGANAQAAARHYVTSGFAEGRARDTFDAAQYLANYGDLHAAFGTSVEAATLHFIQHGYFEGRTDDPLI